jgi:hypothetical protein
MMLAAGTTPTAHATQGLPGTRISRGPSPASFPALVFNENGTLVTLPFSTNPADIVFCEDAGCSLTIPSSWSDVLRLCDTPLDDAACKSATTATHAQLFTGGEGAIAGFTDEFTGHTLDASKLSVNLEVTRESTTGPSSVGLFSRFLTINSDPAGPGEVVEHPVGGHVVPTNMAALLGPWLAVVGVLGCAVVVAVAVKKHRR